MLPVFQLLYLFMPYRRSYSVQCTKRDHLWTLVHLPLIFLLAFILSDGLSTSVSGEQLVHQDAKQKTVTLSDGQGHLVLRLNYDNRCILDQVIVRGSEVAGDSGVCTGIRAGGQWFTTENIATPRVATGKDTLTVSG